MDRQELYEFLDIETPADFQYVENISQYLESEDEMEIEDLREIFAALDGQEISGLLEEYFEEIMESVPDGETETYELLSNVLRSLTGLIKAGYTDGIGPDAVDEMERFRRWYSMDSHVYLTDESGTEHDVPVRDALFTKRMEKLGEPSYRYDFTEAYDYPLDDYAVSLRDLIDMDGQNTYEEDDEQ